MSQTLGYRPAFREALEAAWQRTGAFLCVGLDPLPERLPESLRALPLAESVPRFCRDIVAATARHACVFKPQIAHFAALGLEAELANLIRWIHDEHPEIPVILDAKRGDIGSTAQLYAREAFERYQADAVTVNPFLGQEGLQPFLDYADRGTIVLCRTSNPDSAWLQKYPAAPAEPAYLRVARAAAGWNTNGNVMLVAGATYPEEIAAIRSAAESVGLLVPGIGAQGGDLAAVFRSGATRDGYGLVVNSSRGIIYASDQADYAEAAADVAGGLASEMRELRRGAN